MAASVSRLPQGAIRPRPAVQAMALVDDIHLDHHLRLGQRGREERARLGVGGVDELQAIVPVERAEDPHRAPAHRTPAVEEDRQSHTIRIAY